MQFRSRPFWMRCPKHFHEISWGTSVPSYCHLWQVRRWTPAGALPVPCFHETSNLAWRQKILRKTGKKTLMFLFSGNLPGADQDRRWDQCSSSIAGLAEAPGSREKVRVIGCCCWLQGYHKKRSKQTSGHNEKTTIASISRLFGSRWLCHKQHLHMK